MTESRLVIGAGGTGRTHLLASWAGDVAGDVPILTASPLAPVTSDEIEAALARGAEAIAIDDLQWLESAALDAVTAAARITPVLASRRPTGGSEPDPDALDALTDLLTRTEPAVRLGLLDVDRFAAVLADLRARAEARDGGAARGGALATEEVERLHAATAGSVGFAADAVATAWDGALDTVPAALVDAVSTRIRRAGPAASALAALWALTAAPGTAEALAVALRALPDNIDPSVAERSARGGGLVTDDGSLIPLVARCAGAGLTGAERAALHDRLANALTDDRLAAAEHLVVGAGEVDGAPRILASAAMGLAVTDPGQAPRFIDRAEQLGLSPTEGSLLRALTAFHAGSPDALAHLDAAQSSPGGADDDRSAVLGYGIDTRDLRFESAARRPIAGDLGEPLRALALGLAGRPSHLDEAVAATPLGTTLATVANAVHDLADGSVTASIGGFSTAADDFDRLRPTAPFGMTPHAVGSLGALLVGDLAAVELLTSQAIEQRSGGTGEALTHRLLQAYGRLVAGDYSHALAVLRDLTGRDVAAGPGEAADEPADDLDDVTGEVSPDTQSSASIALLSQRDRLLLASLEAAIARRSGDTGRLRAAWRRAEEALIRPSSSWLFADPFAELLAAGARLGDRRRVGPVVDQLTEQGLSLPASGPGPTSAHWLRLQVAIAADDHAAVSETAAAMAGATATDERSLTRIDAAGIWARIAGAGDADRAGEDEIIAVAERLSAIGDGWEASRILGQAALDEPDPKAARRMLELARISASEHVDETSGEGLSALGLSEREAEVALLVVEGRTHKEVGAQLFISPKTVEHHVAKIRQKVGASSRAELLSIIREAVGGS